MHGAVAKDRPGVALFDWYIEKDGKVSKYTLGDFGKYAKENMLA